MDTLLHTRITWSIKTVGRTRRKCTEATKTQESAGKVMTSVFWYARGIIYINYLQKGRTITGTYYSALLDRLVDEIKEKRYHLQQEKILYHNDNAPSHISIITKTNKHKIGFELFSHPPYSPDLAPETIIFF